LLTGSFHGSDLFHVFGTDPEPPSAEMVTRWISFAYYLDPNPPGPNVWVHWPPYHKHKGESEEGTSSQGANDEDDSDSFFVREQAGEHHHDDRILVLDDLGLSRIEHDSFRKEQMDYLNSIVDSLAF
jgi:hypothetical protein